MWLVFLGSANLLSSRKGQNETVLDSSESNNGLLKMFHKNLKNSLKILLITQEALSAKCHLTLYVKYNVKAELKSYIYLHKLTQD